MKTRAALFRGSAQVEKMNMASKSAATKTVPTKAKAAPPKDADTPEKDGAETPDAPLPLLDLSDAAVKKMIKSAKKRGYVTYEQLNAVMPSEEVTSEKIEDILAMMNEMGINVVGTRKPRPRARKARRPRKKSRNPANWSRSPPSRSPSPRPRSRPTAPTIRCGCTCAKWARSNCSRVRAKSPSPSASRPAVRP